MPVDWGEAVRVGGVGFGLVFIVFIILTLAVGLIGRIFYRPLPKQDKPGSEKAT